jgi:uncharacterized protein YhaN
MRLASLDLQKFGAFDRLNLVFRRGARLHVVYGPNEAGKSTALAAVGALLFGVPERTAYAYRFPGQELRIGAEIVASDGRMLAFRRRKGRKNTLQGRDGEPLSDDALAPFLGVLREDLFRRSFGLDAAELRRGGEAMLRADGDLGAAMLEAASGLRGLVDLRKALDEEAEGVFGERKAGHRLFYQALDRFASAREAIREKELRVDEWKSLNAEIDEVSRKLDAVRAERRAGEEESARLSRHRRALPALNDIRALEAELSAFGDLPLFSSGAVESLQAALDEASDSAKEVARVESEVQRLAEELAAIPVDTAVLAAAAAIETLFQESGGYVNQKRDLPRIQVEADKLLAELEGHARALGLGDVASLQTSRPSAAAVATVRSLIDDGRKGEIAHSARLERLARERRDFEALRAERGNTHAAVDPGPLRKKFALLDKVAEQARALAAKRAEVSVERRELKEAVARLDPTVADLDVLARSPLPAGGDLTRFAKEFEQAERDARDAAKALESVEKQIAETQARLARLVAGGPLATPEAIRRMRDSRDHTWRALRATLLRPADAPPDDELPERVVEFEKQSREADRLSDRASNDSQRLAAHALEIERLEGETRAHGFALAEVEKASALHSDLERTWADLWKSVCDHPKPPLDMRAWSENVQQLLKARDKLLAREAAQEREQADLAKLEPLLQNLAAEMGVEQAAELDVALLADHVERRLAELVNDWDASHVFETRLREASRRLDEVGAEVNEAALHLEEWRTRWGAAVAPIGLKADAPIKAAEAALEVWEKAVNDAENHRDRARRVAGMRRDTNEFEARARALVERCAPEAANLPAEAAARQLNKRLADARESDARRADAARRVEAGRRAAGQALVRRNTAAEDLGRLAAQQAQGCDPANLLARERERSRLAEALRRRRQDLALLADGVEEARIADEIKDFDPDAAAARLSELARQDGDLGRRENELYADCDRLGREREALEAGVGAEEAWQQRRNAETELLEAARRWAVVKAASFLLGGALERHRMARRDPLMTRAGGIFAMLTGAAFEGLDQSFDDDDELRLVGVRRGGERVPVAGLSEGTRDQLYLALRLAAIEDYASRAEAPAFIGDDIFASFDLDRTGHGLEALAAIGDRVQPILFTHHPHVVEAARARLGQAVDIIRIGANTIAAIAA